MKEGWGELKVKREGTRRGGKRGEISLRLLRVGLLRVGRSRVGLRRVGLRRVGLLRLGLRRVGISVSTMLIVCYRQVTRCHSGVVAEAALTRLCCRSSLTIGSKSLVFRSSAHKRVISVRAKEQRESARC